jgi:uncharacterized secreted protein with C-terminal beta-propeller domain
MRGRFGATIVVVALLAAGCTDTPPNDDAGRPRNIPAPGITAASLERFDACPELLTYLREEGAERVGPYGLPDSSGYGTVVMDSAAAAESGDAAAAPEQRSAEGTDDFSTTNVQEEGVDEPDTVKTNGRYIFTTRSDENGRMRLVAVAIDDGRPKAGGSIQLPEGAGSELLLDGDRVVVIGGSPYIMPMRGSPVAEMAIAPESNDTIVVVVDVSEPGEMQVTDVVKLEGSYASARMVGGIARLVLNTSTQERIDFEEPAAPTEAAANAALEKNKRIARTAPISDWLPHFTVEDAKGEERSEGQLADCSSTYHPKTFSGFGTTTVVTLDPRDPDPRNSAAVVGGAGVIYASTDNLYVATQYWGDPRPLAVEDGVTGAPDIAPIDPAKTSIHRFNIVDPTRAVYAASGEVKGTVLNQWSLSEHEGHLRIATTEDTFNQQGASASESFVTVLDATEPKLDQVGQVSGLGVGERIYGVRFIGDVGYVVTFKQIDPLHVVDLSDPAKPRVLGELKIPGYSAYLHPVGDGLLLGIGQDIDEETSQQLGTQVSLFDVSDPSKPTRIDQVRIDNASSPVEYDHHAFTWWDPTKLAVVPVSRYGGEVVPPGAIVDPDGVTEPGPDGGTSSIEPESIEQLHVAIGYRVDDGEISEIGRANHARHTGDTGLGVIERSIVIGDALFTVSGAGIMSSELDSIDERGWFAFES